ncbi:glycerophosphodiester phosphodiesterase [Allobaculum sp. JKK-2023]|uniref:glycerophosphodiester phosphodiesterase n=1 Tax=Allobaculum sp. JKK-2023 TaxID=3108943 RepID=UPI002B05A98D|nr:glycerophosphodiester phosphodiesterase [Allobaculum sp. JKK-2023]
MSMVDHYPKTNPAAPKSRLPKSTSVSSSKTVKAKVRKKRLRRGLIRAIKKFFIALIAIACCLVFMHTLIVPSIVDTHLSSGEFSDEQMIAFANERLLNRSSKSLSRIPVFAHRGFVNDSLDNSYASFDLALLSGCPQIELDVHASSDGVLYVSHDNNLSGISGSNWKITDHTSAELDGILMKNGEKLHRLSEVIERYRDQMIYLVELKDDSPDPAPFLDVVRGHPQLAENIQVQSFYPEVLENIRTELPNMFVQYLVNDRNTYNEALKMEWLDSIALDQKLVSQDVINQVHQSSKEIWVWTVDSIDKVREYLRMGVNGVITDLDSAVIIYKEMSFEEDK